ncbi:MAG TPA: cysteine desulfurase family protein [Polyangiaceae bacterium]|nr:cysteine desulfurase family protein [Polyangiaceae bacterium]
MTRSSEIYLDWNATAPPHPLVLAAMAEARGSAWGNPASVHGAGRRARAVLDDARAVIAELLERDPRDVLFTSGGTEANNLALAGAPAIVTSRLEHPSVTRVAEARAAAGLDVRWLAVGELGLVEPAELERALAGTPPGTVVAVAAVNHETGVVQPLAALSEVTARSRGRLHVDAVQAAGRVRHDLWRFGDTVAVAAHKLRGPKGIGALGVKPGFVPSPVLLGGSQERGLRPGTVDAVAAAGFAAAARRAGESVTHYAALAPLRDAIERTLRGVATVNAAGAPRASHVTSLAFAGRRGDELAAALDLEGIRTSSGSACTAGTSEPSAVIGAMLGRERALSTLRVSLGEETTEGEVSEFLGVLAKILARAPDASGAG